METLDEQLDAANAKVTALEAEVASLGESLKEAETAKQNAEAVNAELSDNLAATKDKLAAQEIQLRDALAEVEKLKADAKTAEERAAEIYGAEAGKAAAVTAKGDPATLPVADRFKAISDPAAQTAFLRSLSEGERAELFSNI